MMKLIKPYLILPKLIVQPTWGGDYIVKLKKWDSQKNLLNLKIGQSYELFSNTKVLINTIDSNSTNIVPELGVADSEKIINNLPKELRSELVSISKITNLYPKIFLIKITQALGNSFQLHIRPSEKDPHWLPKPESWYYLEDGIATYGIKKNINLDSYKKCCLLIEAEMKRISARVKNKTLTVDNAKKEIKALLKKTDPWQFVNICRIKKDTSLDLSAGGIHHSWEEDKENYPLGNVLYEIQKDVMDPVSTIRSFDQGKIGEDGSIRKISIEDYFKYLDSNPAHNKLNPAVLNNPESKLIKTPHYCLSRILINKDREFFQNRSFAHLFVRSGKVVVSAKDGYIILDQGHSCFVPEYVDHYQVKPILPNSIILKSGIYG